jgi:hypothetical protein
VLNLYINTNRSNNSSIFVASFKNNKDMKTQFEVVVKESVLDKVQANEIQQVVKTIRNENKPAGTSKGVSYHWIKNILFLL